METPEPTPTPAAAGSNPLAKYLVIEEGPALGAGALGVEDDRTMTSLCHLFSLIIWLWKRKESPAVDIHGKEALNMAITWIIISFPLSIIFAVLPRFIGGFFGFFLNIASLAVFALFIYGFILARQGKLLRYPLNFRLIK